MSYSDSEPSNSQRLRVIGLIVAMVVLVLVTMYAPWSKIAGGWLWSPERIEKAMLSNPDVAPMMRELKADFPAAFADMVSRYSIIMRDGGTMKEAEADLEGQMRSFVRSKTMAIAASPDEALVTLAKARAKMIAGIQARDVHDCAAIASGKSEALDRYTDLIAPTSRLMIAAAHQGELTPVRRNSSSLSPGDVALLRISAIALGMTEAQFRLMDSPYAMNNATDADQCAVNVFMAKAVAKMPPSLSAQVTAIMVRSANQ
jgi:hypothetical protein